MSTQEQRERLKAHYKRNNAAYAEWAARGYRNPQPKTEPMQQDLIGLECGAKTRTGTRPANKRRFIAMAAVNGMEDAVQAQRLRKGKSVRQ